MKQLGYTVNQWLDLFEELKRNRETSYYFNTKILRGLTEIPWGALDPINSLDDIIRIIEATLPGWAYKFGTCSVSDDAWIVPDFNCPIRGPLLLQQYGPIEAGSIWDTGIDVDNRPSGNLSMTPCMAFCRAMAYSKGHKPNGQL